MPRKTSRGGAKATSTGRQGNSSLSARHGISNYVDQKEINRCNQEQSLAGRITLRTVQPTSSRDLCYFCSLKVENTSLDKSCSRIGCGFTSLEIHPGDQEGTENPEEERLCYLCSRLDFPGIFVPQIPAGTDSAAPKRHSRAKCVLNRDISVIKSHSRCPFCRLLLNTIQLNGSIESLGCVVLRGYVEEFAVAPQVPSTHQESFLRRRLWIAGLNKTQYEEQDDEWSPLRDYLERTYTHCIQLQDLSSNLAPAGPRGLARGARDRRSQIDMSAISSWLSVCEGLHKKCGRSPHIKRDSTFTLRVIDIDRGCIVEAAPRCRYIALSYVWGGTEQLQLSKNTYSVLTQSKAITPTTENIPKTIRDAMILCKGIGERFLWVDSLCIIQDAPGDKHAQIMNMDHIYSHALLTLVDGAGSNANAGLPGVHPNSTLTNKSPVSIDDMELISIRHDLWPAIKDSVWLTRGWTLQEYVLSKRVLFIVSGAAIFLCQDALWKEDTGTYSITHERQRFLPCGLGIVSDAVSRDVAQGQYRQLVSAYSVRNFTKDYDILNAFEGVLNTFIPLLGNSIYGIPEEELCLALLWRSKDPALQNDRREGFPSWSWSGWKHRSPVDLQ